MNRALDRWFDNNLGASSTLEPRSRYLPVDVRSEEDAYVISAIVPGMEADDLLIEINDDVVTIRGEYQQNGEQEEDGYLLKEIRAGKFERSFTLPTALDDAKADANIKNGVLTLRIPKAEEALPKTVKVKAK
jgi:HSP20 family protein